MGRTYARSGTKSGGGDWVYMDNDLVHYGIGTAFVALVAASAIFGLSQISTATQSNAKSATVESAETKERTVRVVLESPFGR